MPGRSYNANGYRFGFNGQEKDDEVSNITGGNLNFKFRMYDSRLGKFFSIDPLAKSYPWNSTYAFAENQVIWAKDLEGAERLITISNVETGESQTIVLPTAGSLGEGILYATQINNSLLVQYQPCIEIGSDGSTSGGEVVNVPVSYLSNNVKGNIMSSSSPLSMDIKKSVMTSTVSPGFTVDKETVRTTADVMEYGGLGLEIIGAAITPLAPEAGIPINRAGAIISNTGSVINATLDFAEGNYTTAIIGVVGVGAGTAMEKSINSLNSVDASSKVILKQSVGVKQSVGEKIIESTIEKSNQNDD